MRDSCPSIAVSISEGMDHVLPCEFGFLGLQGEFAIDVLDIELQFQLIMIHDIIQEVIIQDGDSKGEFGTCNDIFTTFYVDMLESCIFIWLEEALGM